MKAPDLARGGRIARSWNLETRTRNVDARLKTFVTDNLVADFAAHRRDTEAHPTIYKQVTLLEPAGNPSKKNKNNLWHFPSPGCIFNVKQDQRQGMWISEPALELRAIKSPKSIQTQQRKHL